MKRIIITIATFVASVALANAQGPENAPQGGNYTRQGDTFVQGARRGSSRSSDDQPTAYTWRDTKGNEYPIFLHTYTKGEKAGRTTCYVVKTSAKTGKEYKYYIPDGEAIAREILGQSRSANHKSI